MSVLSQFMGGGGTLVGQSIPMQGAIANFTDGSQEFLRSGYLKAYSATYNAYKNRLPAGCVVRQTPVESATTNMNANQTNSNGVIAYNGTNYVLYLACTGGTINSYKSTDLVNWNPCGNSGTWANISACFDYCVTNTGVIMLCTNDASEGRTVKRCENGNWSDISFNDHMSGATASPTTVVITRRLAGNTSSNAIFTSSDGGNNFTARTGSGGTGITMESIFYSPCSSAFFIVGIDQNAGNHNNQGNLILNKTTNGWTQTVGLASDSTFKVNVNNFRDGNKNHFVASSPTVTLISNGAGLLKRTTDGNTWTNVDLTTVTGTDVIYSPEFIAYRIYYSSVTSRFYVATNNSLSSGVRYLVSSDGLTWTPSFNFIPGYLPSSNQVNYAFTLSTANSRILMPWIDTNGAGRVRVLDMTSKMGQTDPDFVGVPSATIGTLPAYVRIL
jgi:hypothetical protein